MRSRIIIIVYCVAVGAVAWGVGRVHTPVSSGATAQCAYFAGGALPDPKCTPSAINHAVTQANINKTICVPGWTATQRPDVRVTEPEKRVSARQYGYVFGTSLANYEYDHLIPLELGGAPNDLKNLWPEPHHVTVMVVSNNGSVATQDGSFAKDSTENNLHRLVCAGKMKLWQARKIMRLDWRTGD